MAAMFGFTIKKAFFDLWDNFLTVMLINLGFLIVLTVPFLLAPAASNVNVVLGLVTLAVGIGVAFLYLGGASEIAATIVDFKTPEWRQFWPAVKKNAPASVIIAGITVVHALLLSVAMPVYWQMANLFSLFALAMIFWMSVLWWLAAQYYFPVRTRLDSAIPKVLKKSLILFFDNAGFTLVLGIATLITAAISMFTAFLIPGIGGILIFHQVGARLRLKKYDYLEENPEEDRKGIPWDALLYDDRERVGKRTLRGMIFPWKE